MRSAECAEYRVVNGSCESQFLGQLQLFDYPELGIHSAHGAQHEKGIKHVLFQTPTQSFFRLRPLVAVLGRW